MMTDTNSTLNRLGEPSAAANLVWIVILTFASIGGSLVISCVAPFVALAVALAGTVRLASALRAMTAIWLTNQFVGFVFYHFPRTANTMLWGLAIGGAALLSTLVAAFLMKRATAIPVPARAGLALALSFATYEGSLFVAALFLGGIETFSPAIVVQVAFSNVVWFIGLVGLNELVAILCKPWLGVTPRLLKAA